MISEKSIQRLKEQADIIDIISHYIPLKKAGASYRCLCPFHDDKNPSMSVSPQKQMYHCFSCKAGGDAIKFVMDYEKIGYADALEKIAKLCNFSLEYTKADVPQKQSNKQILNILNASYRANLFHNPKALEYLQARGLDSASIERFELGWAGDSMQSIRVLQNEQIPPHEALEVGAIKQNEKGFYASFIERITFPIYNHTGALVGFGGRSLNPQNPAKYLNSPQSEIFDKSRLLYGYNLAKKEILQSGQIIITEGYLDVIMLHQAGFKNAVAVLGTALTTKHLSLLRKGEISVTLCFDGDEAGVNAAIKSAHLLSSAGIDGSVVLLNGGADPADMIAQNRINELKQIFKSGVELGRFYINHIISKHDISRPALKQRAAKEIGEFIRSLPGVIASEQARYAAQMLGLSQKELGLSFAGLSFKKPLPAQTKNIDMLEAIVLKSMLENKSYAEYVLKNPKQDIYFTSHKDAFLLISKAFSLASKEAISALRDDEFIRELSFSENIAAASSISELEKALIHLNIRYWQQRQKAILASQDEQSKMQNLEKVAKILAALNQNLQRIK